MCAREYVPLQPVGRVSCASVLAAPDIDDIQISRQYVVTDALSPLRIGMTYRATRAPQFRILTFNACVHRVAGCFYVVVTASTKDNIGQL